MHPLRSLRNRLAVVFGLIVLGAIATVYLTTVAAPGGPADATRSSSGLRGRRAALRRPTSRPCWRRARRARPSRAASRPAASRSSAEVLVMKPLEGKPTGLTLAEDSTVNGGVESGEVSRLALEAFETGKPRDDDDQRRRRPPGARRRAADGGQARSSASAVFADALADVEANVALIRRQILVSGAAALVIALLAGYLVARALSLRVKRLERAARKVSAGDFTDPIRADSDDELGQLAAAFDDMQAQLARLDRARKQFIASASHELRTPIFSLGGFLELLADEELDDDTRAPVPRADPRPGRAHAQPRHRAAGPLAAGGRRARAAARADRRRAARARGRRGVHAGRLAAPTPTSSCELAGEPIELECDPERVAQVLRILLDNALVHTPEGTGVRVSAARVNGHVRLEVSDRGLGIKRQNMPHIFEPFFTSNDEAQGAGLGLAIARELAERMHGELSVRSAPGRTTFSLELPS